MNGKIRPCDLIARYDCDIPCSQCLRNFDGEERKHWMFSDKEKAEWDKEDCEDDE